LHSILKRCNKEHGAPDHVRYINVISLEQKTGMDGWS